VAVVEPDEEGRLIVRAAHLQDLTGSIGLVHRATVYTDSVTNGCSDGDHLPHVVMVYQGRR